MNSISEVAPRAWARIAGLLYLAFFACSVPLAIRSAMIVPGDARATAAHILASEGLYRLTIATDLLAYVCYIGVAFMLYYLLRPAGRRMSLLAALFCLAGCTLLAVDTISLLTPLIFLEASPALTVFTPGQIDALVLASLRSYAQGYNLGLTFFGCYCFLIGLLILRSTFLPRFLGVLLVAAGAGWLTFSLATIVSPPVARHVAPFAMGIGFVAEGLLAIWLVVAGVNMTKWD